MKIPKTGFTDTFVRNLKPGDKRIDIADPGKRGLRLRVSTGGTKTWAWMFKHNGYARRYTIGVYPTVSLADARRAVETLREKHKAGVMPEQQETSDRPRNVAALADVFYRTRVVPLLRRPDATKQILDHDIVPAIGNKSLATVTTVQLGNIIDAMVARDAKVHAGRCLAVMKQMFAFAESRGFMDRNPATSMKRADYGISSEPRERRLSDDEVAVVWRALNEAPRLSDPIKYGLKLLLLTGARSGELRQARWEHIDWDAATWTVPGVNRKSHRKGKTPKDWVVPLPPLALELFRELHTVAGDSPWVMFSGTGQPVTDKSIARAVKRLLASGTFGDMDPWTPHDLRRTFRSGLSRLGVEPHVAEIALSHSLGGIVRVYDKHSYADEHRAALELWARHVAVVAGIAGDNVVGIRA